MASSRQRYLRISTVTPSQTLGYPVPQSGGSLSATSWGIFVVSLQIRLGVFFMTTHASSLHWSAAGWKKSDNEAQKTIPTLPSASASFCHLGGFFQVVLALVTTAKSGIHFHILFIVSA